MPPNRAQRELAFQRNIAAARQFYSREGHLRVPRSHVEIIGTASVSLGIVVSNIRTLHKSEALDADRISAWKSVGMIWSSRGGALDRTIAAAQQFHDREGHLRVPQFHVETVGSDPVKLGLLVMGARQRHKDGTLSAAGTNAWQAVGMVWDAREDGFERALTAARQFRDREGHLRVPKHHVEMVGSNSVKLAQIVSYARTQYRRGTLGTDRMSAWESIGIAWSAADDKLERATFERTTAETTTLAAATQFRAREGHLRVPRGHVERVGQEEIDLESAIRTLRLEYQR